MKKLDSKPESRLVKAIGIVHVEGARYPYFHWYHTLSNQIGSRTFSGFSEIREKPLLTRLVHEVSIDDEVEVSVETAYTQLVVEQYLLGFRLVSKSPYLAYGTPVRALSSTFWPRAERRLKVFPQSLN